MNKKKLSVVMAGAMLATSVAPVLAAETTATEIGTSKKATLKKTIKDKMAEKYLTTNSVLVANSSNAFLEVNVKNELTATKDASAYGVRVLDKNGKAVDLNDLSNKITQSTKITYKVSEMEEVVDHADFKAGMTIEIVERTTSDFYGELIPGNPITPKTAVEKYKSSEIVDASFATNVGAELKPASSLFVDTVTTEDKNEDSTKDTIKVTLNTLTDINDADSKKVIELTTESNKLDGRLPLDVNGKLLDVNNKDDIQKFDHFAELITYNPSTENPTAPTTVAAYKLVTDEEDKNVTSTVADLYDGFALTAKGTELLSELKNAANKAEEEIGAAATGSNTTKKYPRALVQLSSTVDNTSTNGVYSFTVTYFDSKKDLPENGKDNQVGNPSKILTVRSTNKTEITSLYNLLKTGTFSVGIVGGDNRYETAVNVAKANGANLKYYKGNKGNDLYNNNIVIVNGESLVDGLSAAPLAASLNSGKGNNAPNVKQAPVLLSKTDELPTATKEYIEELAIDLTKKERKDYTVTLVGGESVLSEELVKEIEDMGFKVERFGGDNREETSVEVAEAILAKNKSTKTDAFVVGGNGEADAMSISAVAADKKAPIIVSSVHGLSRDGLKFIEKYSKTEDVAVVGGEGVVSAKEYAKIDEVTDNKVKRLAGDNRFETNAAVIKEFYKGETANGVVLVKDGVATKNELIDALSAANYAARMDAPIVLASTSLKDNQKDALLNVTVPKASTIAQVGIGAEITVLETIAGLFGISNK